MTALLARTLVGALSPEHVSITLTVEDEDDTEWLDLSTGSNIQLLVRKPSGALQTWNCTITGVPTATELTAYHAYQADELDEDGDYSLVARGTFITDFGTGPVLFSRQVLRVRPTYD